MADRKLIVQILGDSRQLERTFARSSRDASKWGKSLERAGRGGIVATVGFRGLGRSVAFASGAFLGGAGFVAGARAAIKASSDLAEEQNKTRVLFGESAGEIVRWSKTTATALGLSRRAAQQAAGNFGAMFSTLELGDKASTTMSKRLVTLGSDLASFANQDPSDMLDRLRGGLSGEAEPLRRFGILLSEARVKNEAYRSGLAKSGAELTEQQKVLARFNLILADSTDAQGDFARTSKSQANQERINAALREEAAERIGSVLLPLYNRATRAVNKWLGEEKNLAKIQRTTQQIVTTSTKVVKAFVDVAQDVAPVLQRVNKLLGGTEQAVKLLLTVFVVSKVVSFASAITGLGTASLATTGRVNLLRGALLRLGAIGVITIGVEVIMNRQSIDKKVRGFLQRNRLGFLAGGAKIDVPVDIDADSLQIVRDRLAEIKGEGDLVVKTLDKMIQKLRVAEAVPSSSRGEGRSAEGVARANRKRKRRQEQDDNDKDVLTREQLIKRFQRRMAVLDLALERAGLTKNLQDDLAVLQREEQLIKSQFRIEGRTLDLQGQLLDVEKRRASILDELGNVAKEASVKQRERQKQLRERVQKAKQQAQVSKQVRQFEALGLTSEGAERVPGVGALSRRLGNLRKQLRGTPLDTDKTRSQLARISKVLSGAFGKTGRDVRQAILGMLNDISSALSGGRSDAQSGPLTKFRVANFSSIADQFPSLSPEDAKRLQQILSRRGAGGTMPRSTTTGGAFGFEARSGGGFGTGNTIVTGPVTVVANDPAEFHRQIEKRRRRNAGSRTGPRAGSIGGV